MIDILPHCAVRHRTYYDFQPYGLKNLCPSVLIRGIRGRLNIRVIREITSLWSVGLRRISCSKKPCNLWETHPHVYSEDIFFPQISQIYTDSYLLTNFNFLNTDYTNLTNFSLNLSCSEANNKIRVIPCARNQFNQPNPYS